MENFIWISWSHRIEFETYADLNEYFQDLQKECKKAANFKKALVSGKIAEWIARKKEKMIEKLIDKKELKDYALFYYYKYFPSRKKLYNKLCEKNKNLETVNLVMEAVESLITPIETSMVENKISNFIQSWKNFAYIRNKMREKLFERDMVENILCKYENMSILKPEKVKKKIMSLLQKWKSLSIIKRSIVENNNDEAVFEEALIELWLNWDYKTEDPDLISVRKLVKKYKIDWLEDKKIVSRILMKWFKYDILKKVLLEEKNIEYEVN